LEVSETSVRLFLDRLARRWRLLARLRSFTRAGLGLVAVWLAALVAGWLVGRASLTSEALVIGIAILATVAVLVVAWMARPRPATTTALARLAEERVPALEDRVATAADVLDGHRPEASPPVRAALLADAAATLRALDLDDVIPPTSVRSAAWRAAAVAGLLMAAGLMLGPPTARVARAALIYGFPTRLVFHVDPGNVRVRPGTKLVIRVEASSSIGGLVPELVARIGDTERRAPMMPDGGGRFSVTFDTVPASFNYHVQLAGRRSPDFQVTLLEPPRVARIDLTYDFPSYTRLTPRSETDGGDVFAPQGTRVHLLVRPREATARVASAELSLGTGKRLPLTPTSDGSLAGDLVVSSDETYRVRLTDTDGLQNTDDPEYFVRMLDDRPPEVRIVRPAGDRQVTPLEEVEIEARADDDHGVDRLELVVGVRGRGEKVVPLGGDGASLTVTGHHTILLEELEVSPGDFVTFYARARDIGRGKRPSEARSDIFFLEVTPFADEFALAQSQAMAGAAGKGMDDLVRLQKDIIVATWKLDRRAAGSQAAPSVEDLRTLARAQASVRQRTEAAASRAVTATPLHAASEAADESAGGALAAAVVAMVKAESALGARKTSLALPAEMEALNRLLKAQSEAARKEVVRQQAGAGGGSSRAQQDLSSLFDRELQRQQQTNYEMPKTAEEKRDDSRDQTLDRVRELARRQESLARQQDDVARDRQRMDPEEVRRRLERLTREQSDLRREAELLAQQREQDARRQEQGARNQQPGSDAKGAPKPGSDAGGQASALRQASEDMRAAASQLRREDPGSARGQSAKALERLRGVERALSEAGPDQRRRAVGDAELEARQLASRQRQLSDQVARPGTSGDPDARRRLAGDEEQLATRAEALGTRLGELSSGGSDKAEKERLAGAAHDLAAEQVPGAMRDLAKGLQQGNASATKPEAGRAIARSLDKLADEVTGPAGSRDREGQQLSEALSRARDLRERLAELERQMAEAGRDRTPAGSANGDRGPTGTSKAGRDVNRLADLRQQYIDALKQASEGDPRLRDAVAGTSGAGSTPIGQAMVTAAPGTEAFKQDFARWDSLHREVTDALERFEASLSQRAIEKEAHERLRSGNADDAPADYAGSVDRYFRALAEEPR
jgi:hypothetical protein